MGFFDNGILRSSQPDGVCACCGHVGQTWADTRRCTDGSGHSVSLGPEEWETPPLCDTCDVAQRRWDARQFQILHPGYGYPYMERPPLSPPVRREGDRELGPHGWPI